MRQLIELGAMVVREGRLLLVRTQPGGAWALPGGAFPEDSDDMDAAMDGMLSGIGIHAPAVEDDFIETVFLPYEGGQVVLNLYAPTEWMGEPVVAPGVGVGWFGLDELELIEMDAGVRNGVLRAFGMQATEDNSGAILAAMMGEPGLGVAAEAPPASGTDAPVSERRLAGLDVLRTLSGGHPEAEAGLRRGTGELADAILDFSMGEVWQNPALDRRTRSLEVVAMLAATGRIGSLRSHIIGALNHGATPEQVRETLKMVAVYGGFPAAVDAWPVMEAAFAERGVGR